MVAIAKMPYSAFVRAPMEDNSNWQGIQSVAKDTAVRCLRDSRHLHRVPFRQLNLYLINENGKCCSEMSNKVCSIEYSYQSAVCDSQPELE